MIRKPRYLRAGLALFAVLLIPACSPLSVVNALAPKDGYTRVSDIPYGPDPRHRLDVYKPAEPGPAKPVIVFLYGGSWKKGKRVDYEFVGQSFASRGFVTVVPDYRLYPEVQFPAFVEDAAAAIAWVRKNISAHGGDPDRIVLSGHSAGAHIAAMVAYDGRYLKSAGVPAGSIAGLAGLAGPYSFDPLAYRTIRPIFQTASPPESARPISFVTADAPPALLLHGTSDGTVYPKNSEELNAKLRANGVPVRLVELEEVGHIGILLALAEPFSGEERVINEIVGFAEGLQTRIANRAP